MLKTLDQISQINQPKMHTRVYFSLSNHVSVYLGMLATFIPEHLREFFGDVNIHKTEFGMDQNWVWGPDITGLLDDSSFISAFTCRCHSWDNKTVLTYYLN
jgi:hypothetical protein